MKYSIIISAYNQAKNFKKIMRSLREQTFQDFEVIIGDDGSSDGLRELLGDVKYYYQEDRGYGFTSAMNGAAKLAEGDYLVFLNGDSYLDTLFLDEMNRVVLPDRIVNGIRINIYWSTESEVSMDWRLELAPPAVKELLDKRIESFCVDDLHHEPWVLMTLTGLVIPRKMFEKLGGLTPVYDGGYGKMDWSLCMKAFYSGYHLWYHTPAIVYHKYDPDPRKDDEKNTLAYYKEVELWKNKSKLH